ncbi:MAG TPA: MBOAT family O-acyltransferase [Candidatus Acidoferrales bacterium]|nr:MBOAT family O-acyltransferase [Candidatus Acidoferrales bacterium]
MSQPAAQIVVILVYLLAARLAVRRLGGGWREAVFASLNLTGYYFFFVHDRSPRFAHIFAVYGLLVLVQFLALRLFGGGKRWKPWIAFCIPILALIVIRYVPAGFFRGWKAMPGGEPNFSYAPYFVGLSYLAFRTSHLVLEVRNSVVKMPTFWQYVGFCFFVPTMPVGPINPYSNYRRGFDPEPHVVPVGRATLRILVGLVKYKFLGSLCDQLAYSGLLQDDHYHHWMDLPVGMLFYYLYLYCNFSGFCDMAIGAAGLIGIPVAENFDNPFAARNVKDFWNRWHMTLSAWMRDVVFSPLSKLLVRMMGPARANHAIALTIVVVFLLVGIWHGVGWNFAVYGAVHALGVVTNHYYTIWLKKRLGREGFKAYNENRWIRAAAIVVTFCYCGASLLFFANTFPQISGIFASLR